jgi:hypothetical protein
MSYRPIFLAFLFFFAATMGTVASCGRPEGHTWPKITPISKTFYYDADRISLSLDVRNEHGEPAYWFGCHGADFKGKPVDPFHDDEWNYYGLFDCHLHDLHDKRGDNLLSYNAKDPRENFSRALTLPLQLQGRCAEYPEWGRIRHIRLRGMLITLEFTDLKLDKENLVTSFRFNVHIAQDNDARSSFAEPPGFAYPLQTKGNSADNITENCSKVIKEPPPQ